MYKTQDEFIDCMGGNVQALIDVVNAAKNFDNFVAMLPYPIDPDDQIVINFFNSEKKT